MGEEQEAVVGGKQMHLVTEPGLQPDAQHLKTEYLETSHLEKHFIKENRSLIAKV